MASSNLDPRFLLGSSNDAKGELGQLYAYSIGSLVEKQCSEEESRNLLIGVGLTGKYAYDRESDEARDLLLQVLDMVTECRVW